MKQILQRLVLREDCSRAEFSALFQNIFDGNVTPAQLGALLIALRMKGETSDEIAGAAEVMRARATQVRVPAGRTILDTCGTGGDGACTFNISTAVALVAAAGGVTVAKHGNRSVSSQCGSADVLAACGLNLNASVAIVEQSLAELGVGFLFAPTLHHGMKHVNEARREVGVRSIFNLLGPLANPARATRQLLGVYERPLVPVLAKTLAQLGVERALVVHGADGLDEVSPTGITHAAWVEGRNVRELLIHPSDAGFEPVTLESLRGGNAEHNAELLRGVLNGAPGPLRNTVLLNAAAAFWVAGLADDLAAGVPLAERAIDSGGAAAKLLGLVTLSHRPEAKRA